MTANICFKVGKYLNISQYKDGIILLLETIPEIEGVNLTLLFSNNLGIKKDGLTVAEAVQQIHLACEKVDSMPDEAKIFIRENYLETYPEERED
jgi:hypothetical protein